MDNVNLTLREIGEKAGIEYSNLRYHKIGFDDYFHPIEVPGKKNPLYEPGDVELVKCIAKGAEKYKGQQLHEYVRSKGFSPRVIAEKGAVEEASRPQRSSANLTVVGQSSFEHNSNVLMLAYEERHRSLVATFKEHTDEVKALVEIVDKKNKRIEELEERSSKSEVEHHKVLIEKEKRISELENQVVKLKKHHWWEK
jgi:hypothetical protein